jgi:hypothetical protein
MTDDDSTPVPIAPAPRTDAIEPRRGFLRTHWGKLTLVAVVLVPATLFAIWSAITLAFTFSAGERVGYVQKLSRKGWVCKTWEGELQMSNIPGSAPILFQFSVRSDSLARAIEAIAGRRVSLSYEEHPGVPTSCFGETPYFVTGVREVPGPVP